MNQISCMNCRHRCGYYGQCMRWEMSLEDDEVIAMNCENYEDMEDEEYIPSAACCDYSPSAPWNAPGMSIRDFI